MANSTPSFILQEMGIVLGIPQQDPTFFNLDFLTYTGIISNDWELSSQPKRSPQASQLNFINDVSLIAEPNQTMFLENLGEKAMDEIQIPKVANRFVDIMKNINFTRFDINFRGYVAFPNSPRAAHNYFFKALLAPGSWHSVGTAPIRAGLNLVYTFDEKKLNLSVQEAAIRRMDESSIAAIVFSGAFENDYSALAPEARLAAVQQGIQSWETDLKQFIDVVSRFFNQPQKSEPQAAAPTTIPLN